MAVIPARGGSKGLPGKNVRLLDNKPLIVHTIESALGSSYIDRTIVSTDDEEIAAVAGKHNAEVPFLRPPELATDTASSLSVMLHAISHMEKEENYHPDVIVSLPPTAPRETA